MIRSQSIRNGGRVSIETLESRTLLSAAPTHHVLGDAIGTAARVHPVIPAIASATYAGTAISNAGVTVDISIVITTESKAGAIHGVFTVEGTATGAGDYKLTGTVNARDKITFHAKKGTVSVGVIGALSADLKTLSGKYIAPSAKTNGHGTISASRVVSFV